MTIKDGVCIMRSCSLFRLRCNTERSQDSKAVSHDDDHHHEWMNKSLDMSS